MRLHKGRIPEHSQKGICMLTHEQSSTLETLIDSAGLSSVLEGMASICHAKADHISNNNKPLARKWTTAGNRLTREAATAVIVDTWHLKKCT